MLQLQRLMARDGCSEADARARMSAQMPLQRKRALAQQQLDNNGSLAELQSQVGGGRSRSWGGITWACITAGSLLRGWGRLYVVHAVPEVGCVGCVAGPACWG